MHRSRPDREKNLLKFEVRLFDQFGPACPFVVEEFCEIFSRAAFGKGIGFAQPLDDLWRFQGGIDFIVEAFKNGRGRTCRGDDAEPA